ncbi:MULTISPECIES: tetratricopeptide repeat protein [Flammeovirga]|uniref:Tetratricopeptide repeat protein n=1 Tax=Flammeovirga agarivorans TaxID=2726742 RepID=A0A7X8SGR5_9BACT|nr:MULTISPECIES: tetratricopeptide repeat protein [Flammeovirga]NLR89905.1 tetratricopeptide repeat protein [Flammeovirga agarivorans]
MKTKQINLFFISLFLILSACGPSSEDLTNQGKKKLSENKYKEAISLFDAAIKSNVQNMDAYNARGYAHMSLEEYSKAQDDFTEAINIYMNTEEDVPNAYRFYYNRGNVKRFLRDHEGAIVDYTQAIQLDNSISDIYLNRGLENAEINGVEAALNDFDKAIALSQSSDKRIYLHKARVLIADQQFEQALNVIGKAIAIDKEYGEAYYYKALAMSALRGEADDEVCNTLATAEAFGYSLAAAEIQKHCK